MRLPQILVGIGLLSVIPAFGQFTAISQPVSSYTGGTTKITIPGSNGATLTSVSDPTMTLTLSTGLDIHTVPGGGWSTWNTPPAVESATPKVLGTYNVLTSETITLSQPAFTFGFELEPDTFSTFSISASFMNGSTVLGTITQTVNGSAGALLFAANTTTPITSVVITAPAGANGFAIGQLRYSVAAPTIPTLSVPMMTALAMALLAGGSLLARRQNLDHA